jgi:mannosyltransferase OCH1-like enzyme
MIPKIIHYCWLSGERMPDNIQNCIDSWEKYLPDYQWKLWDRNSFDFACIPFTRDALAARKWAFVSDYVRLYALYNEGGIYLDTDVLAFGSIDALLENRLFTGLEMRDKEHTDIYLEGAIIGAEKGHPFIGRALDLYNRRSFLQADGTPDLTPIPTVLSLLMEEMYKWERADRTVHLDDGITIYGTDTIANSNCRRSRTVKLYHLNNRSWIPTTPLQRFLRRMKKFVKSLMGRPL